jgi:hypothetical protein
MGQSSSSPSEESLRALEKVSGTEHIPLEDTAVWDHVIGATGVLLDNAEVDSSSVLGATLARFGAFLNGMSGVSVCVCALSRARGYACVRSLVRVTATVMVTLLAGTNASRSRNLSVLGELVVLRVARAVSGDAKTASASDVAQAVGAVCAFRVVMAFFAATRGLGAAATALSLDHHSTVRDTSVGATRVVRVVRALLSVIADAPVDPVVSHLTGVGVGVSQAWLDASLGEGRTPVVHSEVSVNGGLYLLAVESVNALLVCLSSHLADDVAPLAGASLTSDAFSSAMARVTSEGGTTTLEATAIGRHPFWAAAMAVGEEWTHTRIELPASSDASVAYAGHVGAMAGRWLSARVVASLLGHALMMRDLDDVALPADQPIFASLTASLSSAETVARQRRAEALLKGPTLPVTSTSRDALDYLIDVGAAVSRFPQQLFALLLSQGTSVSRPLAFRGAALLLVLVHSWRRRAGDDDGASLNPFRQSLEAATDVDGLAPGTLFAPSSSDPHPASLPHVPLVRAATLVAPVGAFVSDAADLGVLLLYTVLYTSPDLRVALTSLSDPGSWVLPLLERLHELSEGGHSLFPGSVGRRVVTAVTSLLSTQNARMLAHLHSAEGGGSHSPRWLCRHGSAGTIPLVDGATVGGVMVLVLARAARMSVLPERAASDAYASTNLIASLSNAAAALNDVDSPTAEALAELLELLGRRLSRTASALRDLAEQPIPDDSEQRTSLRHQQRNLETYAQKTADDLHSVLCTVLGCVGPARLERNARLLYALLSREECLSSVSAAKDVGPENLGVLVSELLRLVHFTMLVVRGELRKADETAVDEDQMMVFVREAARRWCGVRGNVSPELGKELSDAAGEEGAEASLATEGASLGDTAWNECWSSCDGLSGGFLYDEDGQPEEFFEPRVWVEAMDATNDLGWAASLKVMKLVSLNEARVALVAEGSVVSEPAETRDVSSSV